MSQQKTNRQKPPKRKMAKNQSYLGKPKHDPMEIVILDGADLTIHCALTNRALKEIRMGRKYTKTFMRGGRQVIMNFMHMETFLKTYKSDIDQKLRVQNERFDKEKNDPDKLAEKETVS